MDIRDSLVANGDPIGEPLWTGLRKTDGQIGIYKQSVQRKGNSLSQTLQMNVGLTCRTKSWVPHVADWSRLTDDVSS